MKVVKVAPSEWVVILMMPLRMTPLFVPSARAASGRRGVTAGAAGGITAGGVTAGGGVAPWFRSYA